MGCDIWHMTESRCIHSQELLLLAQLLVLLAMGILDGLPGLTSCRCENIGLVSLILLGWELLVIYHCTMCTRHPDLFSRYLCHPYIPILISCSFLRALRRGLCSMCTVIISYVLIIMHTRENFNCLLRDVLVSLSIFRISCITAEV